MPSLIFVLVVWFQDNELYLCCLICNPGAHTVAEERKWYLSTDTAIYWNRR